MRRRENSQKQANWSASPLPHACFTWTQACGEQNKSNPGGGPRSGRRPCLQEPGPCASLVINAQMVRVEQS